MPEELRCIHVISAVVVIHNVHIQLLDISNRPHAQFATKEITGICVKLLNSQLERRRVMQSPYMYLCVSMHAIIIVKNVPNT